MTKAIASYPKAEQGKIVSARLLANVGGLGTLAAKDAEYRRMIAKAREQVVKKEADASQYLKNLVGFQGLTSRKSNSNIAEVYASFDDDEV